MNHLLTILFIFLITVSSESYTSFPYTIEAEDCEGAGEPWTSIYGTIIKGDYSGKGFVYLTETPFSFTVIVPEDGMYQFNVKIAQILNQEGRLQTISINDFDFQYNVNYYDTWTDFDFGVLRLNKGSNTITIKPNYGFAEYDTITISKSTFPYFSSINTTLVDPKATKEAQKIQDLLGNIYGKKIISGQQETYAGGNDNNYELEFDYIKQLTGKYPAIRGFDLMNYNSILAGMIKPLKE